MQKSGGHIALLDLTVQFKLHKYPVQSSKIGAHTQHL